MTSGHFIGKAFAAATVGSGPNATAYHLSQYALISQSATAVLLVSVALSTMAVILRDALEKASTAAMTDELSGLLNRRGFDAKASAMLRSGDNLTALILDLDHFKSVNDEFGHAVGDEVIRCLSKVSRDIAPPGSAIARTGGEEFSILLPLGMDDSARFAERLRVAQRDASSSVVGRPVTVSIGLAAVGPDGISTAMRDADLALYQAKGSGRDRVRVASNALDLFEPHPLSA